MEVTFPGGNENTYVPLNFHFHSPSDHTILGKSYDLEMHIVHIEKSTQQLGAVLSILFDSEKGGNIQNRFIKSLNPELSHDDASFIVIDD
jgi:carbonic anhydrase